MSTSGITSNNHSNHHHNHHQVSDKNMSQNQVIDHVIGQVGSDNISISDFDKVYGEDGEVNQAQLAKLQQQFQNRSAVMSMLTNLLKMMHDVAMTIIRNMRS